MNHFSLTNPHGRGRKSCGHKLPLSTDRLLVAGPLRISSNFASGDASFLAPIWEQYTVAHGMHTQQSGCVRPSNSTEIMTQENLWVRCAREAGLADPEGAVREAIALIAQHDIDHDQFVMTRIVSYAFREELPTAIEADLEEEAKSILREQGRDLFKANFVDRYLDEVAKLIYPEIGKHPVKQWALFESREELVSNAAARAYYGDRKKKQKKKDRKATAEEKKTKSRNRKSKPVEVPLNGKIVDGLEDDYSEGPTGELPPLTEVQQQIVDAAMESRKNSEKCSDAEIARISGLTIDTVRWHRPKIKEKILTC